MHTRPISAPETLGRSEAQPKTIRELMRELVAKLSTLFRQEVALARAEMTETLSAARTGVASMALAGGVLFAALLVLLAAAVLALSQVMAAWLAAFSVSGLVAIAGCLLLLTGRRKLDPSTLKPTEIQKSLRRDLNVLARRKL
jgi:hypothetical protein